MRTEELHRQHFDVWLLFIVVALVAIGITMVYSASAVLAQERSGDSYYYLKRSLLDALVGFAVLAGCIRIDYRRLRPLVYPLLAGSLGLVLLVHLPGIGKTVGGATRWINLSFVAFQPSEFAKLALVLFLAYSLEKKAHRIRSLTVGILPHLVVMALVAGTVLYQRDFGTAVVIALVTGLMLFAAGVRMGYLGGMVGILGAAGTALVIAQPYRRSRIFAFLNPWSDQYGTGFQMIQSFVAFNEGGWIGRGLGQGQQKLFYLPEAHTDFIFSVIGEELGLIGVLLVVALFTAFCYRGFWIALRAPDLFGRYLALGMTMLVGLEAGLNMGVVMGLLPTKGLTLPFISYGGSSLLFSLMAAGLVLGVSSYRNVNKPGGQGT